MTDGKRNRTIAAAWLSAGMLLVLAACSGVSFDPTGSYSGTVTTSGSAVPVSGTITNTSTANSWGFTLVSPGGPVSGTCTHDPAGSAGNLTCSFNYSGGTVTFNGTLANNTYAGSYTDTGGPGGSFTWTRS